MFEDIFTNFKYGNIKVFDLHGFTKEEAKSEIIHLLNSIDTNYQGIEFIHGYHGGQVLKKLVREELLHPMILNKINKTASSTIFLLKNN